MGIFLSLYQGEDGMVRGNLDKVKVVLWGIFFANIMVAVLKVAIGTIVNSASITADGLHSFTDGSSNIVGLIAIRLAARPVDEDHPYGHKKYETLASMFISIMLLLVSGKIVWDAISKLFNPVLPEISFESIGIIILTLIVNIMICLFEYRQGKKLKSEILISDSMHTKSDIFVSMGVLITIICIKLGLPAIIDSITSIVISGFIINAAYEIFTNSSNILVDKAVVDTDKIKEIVMEFSNVKDAHKIRSRGKEDDMHIDLHIMIDPQMSVQESHELIHDIERMA